MQSTWFANCSPQVSPKKVEPLQILRELPYTLWPFGDDRLTNSLNDLETVNAEGKRIPARVSARVRAFALIALMLAAICGLQSCGGSGSGTTTIKSVAITPTLITVPLNTQTHFLAVVTLSDSTISSTTTVTWEVNGMAGGDLLTVGSIVPDPDNPLQGDFTAPGQVPTVVVD